MSFGIQFDAADIARLSDRYARLLHAVDDLEPVMEQAAEYMQRSTINRILRTKTAPDGERWAALSDVTAQLKGHDRQLFETGELSRNIEVSDVSKHGFELTADTEYAIWMQKGVDTVRGAFRSKRPRPQIPARPFMGFSEENVRRISKMIRDYLAHGG
ncbi:phage virion morphogenesis protein [Bradyrhizobium sp. SZCCHNRI2010]|uniref:phage virion morphogenesis protein n=1 Tax=Bradyrhizobium sp. SZCCHNRI2010 TaxID=3057283 RepID=UPI0028E7D801|nr:phage virion morphogenesis protein [Bradyrhizobium sp. SZCCHNRI2010]